MDQTRTAAEAEQRQVRLAALGVMLAALIVVAVLVAFGAYVPALPVAAIAGAAWWWAARLYSDLRDQAMQVQAMQNAQRRIVPPVDKYEG